MTRKWSGNVRLRTLLAGLAGMSFLHVAIVEGWRGGACVRSAWCLDCGAATRTTRCELFGLIPLGEATRVEPGPIAAFLARRYGISCIRHVFGGGLTRC